MAKKQLFALFASINAYTNGIRPLNGCIADMQALHDYLLRQSEAIDSTFDFHPLILKNEAATRQAVIDGFQHFAKAGVDDICLFYFSGHGSRIDSKEFWESTDGKIEAIVCYDSCVVGKELSVLIHETTHGNPDRHFLAVMDCCHSGGNTKSTLLESVAIRLSMPNRYPATIQEYYGFDRGAYMPNGKGQFSTPKGKHIQIAACRNYQTAKEVVIGAEIRGAFTASLIEVLETNNRMLSYSDLEDRIARKIDNRIRTADQRPSVESIANADKNLSFLGGAVQPKHRFFVGWNKNAESWQVNAGFYHGVSMGGKYPTTLKTKDNQQALTVTAVFAEYALVTWTDASFVPLKKQTYDVQVTIGGAPLNPVAFAPDCDPAIQKLLVEQFEKSGVSYIQLIDAAATSSFRIQATPQGIALLQDGSDVPVFVPVLPVNGTFGMVQALEFWKKTDAVMQWNFLKSLENPISTLVQDQLEITVFRSIGVEKWWEVQPEQMEIVPDFFNPIELPYQKNATGAYNINPSVAIKIKNIGSNPLFIKALYLSGRFGVSSIFVSNNAVGTEAEVWPVLVSNGKTFKSIGLTIDDDHYMAGMHELTDYIKIMVSTEDFSTTAFEQPSLKLRGLDQPKRTVGFGDEPTIKMHDWGTVTVPFKILRPKAMDNKNIGK
jgi:hypothetical protein